MEMKAPDNLFSALAHLSIAFSASCFFGQTKVQCLSC